MSLIAFQGMPGAYSDLACRTAFPGLGTLPCRTFEAAMEAVRGGEAELAMLPCENSLAGRVPDMHALLPDSGLHIIGEHFQRVEHCLLAPRGATLAQVRRVHSHAVALGPVGPVEAEHEAGDLGGPHVEERDHPPLQRRPAQAAHGALGLVELPHQCSSSGIGAAGPSSDDTM